LIGLILGQNLPTGNIEQSTKPLSIIKLTWFSPGDQQVYDYPNISLIRLKDHCLVYIAPGKSWMIMPTLLIYPLGALYPYLASIVRIYVMAFELILAAQVMLPL
jgi:hypothetical protein